jgi:hypothetical protein
VEGEMKLPKSRRNMAMLTEDDKKRIVEWLGECVHERLEPFHASGVCKYCYTYLEDWNDVQQRTFTEWQDYGDVFEALVGKGAWEKFMWFCEDRFGSKDNTIMPWTYQLFQWLHSRTESGEFRLCQLTADTIKEGVIGK